MNRARPALVFLCVIGIGIFLFGQIKRPVNLAQGWTPPFKVTQTQSADVGGGNLYKWGDTLILLKEKDNRWPQPSTYCILVPNPDPTNSWKQFPMPELSSDYNFYAPSFDQENARIAFAKGYIENEILFMGGVFLQFTPTRGLQLESEKNWTLEPKTIFAVLGTNTSFNGHQVQPDRPNRDYPFLGKGILSGSALYIPYSLHGYTRFGFNGCSNGPFSAGAFDSKDAGQTWGIKSISDTETSVSDMCKTTGYFYYFGFHGPLIWFSRKNANGGAWEEPKPLTKSSANRSGGGAIADDDTIHFCWLDRRHEKWRLNLEEPYVGNYEVAYSRRKDGDSSWRKDIILSRGLKFSYWPTLSVEGKKVAIAWVSGTSNGPWACFDVYYATSKDGGETWTRPLKLTDSAKDGISSERPQIVVLKGVIHLVYPQGKWDRNAQVMQQSSWPVFYQQLPFPD